MERQSPGFTLIELVAALALSAVVIGGLAVVGDGTARLLAREPRIERMIRDQRTVATLSKALDRICTVVSIDSTTVTYVDELGRLKKLDVRDLLLVSGTPDTGQSDSVHIAIRPVQVDPTRNSPFPDATSGLLQITVIAPQEDRERPPLVSIERLVRIHPRPHR